MPVIHTAAELDAAFDEGRPHYLDLRVHAKDGAVMYALVSGEAGWLMYLRMNGDAGFSSRNADYGGSPDAVIQYRLDNGQVDEYPVSWAVPVEEVKKAMQHFLRTGAPAPWIAWHNDSGDGVVIGRTT